MSKQDLSGFVNRFRELMQSRKIMRKKLVDHLGISERALRYYTRGERPMPIDVAMDLADFFGVSLDYLVGRVDDPNGAYKPPMPPAHSSTEVPTE